MAGESSAATESEQSALDITRIFDAPRSLVFKAWTSPEHMKHWFCPRGFTLPVCEMDFRPGGAYRLCMRGPDGKDYWVHGVYREIVEPERIVWTGSFEDEPGSETVMTATFAEHEGKTKLTVHQIFLHLDTKLKRLRIFAETTRISGARQGWSETLDRLADYLAQA